MSEAKNSEKSILLEKKKAIQQGYVLDCLDEMG
jgi:hypothetical protein